MIKAIARNIVANWIGYLFQIVVTFFLTPYVIHKLGDVRYGAWTLVMGVTGYYGLLDLGFRAGLTQYLTRYLATKDVDNFNKTASTGVVILSGVAVIVILVSVIFAVIAPMVLTIPASAMTEVRWGVILVGLMVGSQFPFFLYSACLSACERFDISNAIGIVVKLVTTALTVTFLELDWGLIGVAVAVLIGHVLSVVLRVRIVHRLLPSLEIRFSRSDWRSFAEFTNYGVWNIIISWGRKLISATDAIVIAAFLPVAAVTPYALALSLTDYFDTIVASVGRVFFPRATALDATNDAEGLRTLYFSGTRLILCLSVVMASIGFTWAEPFYRLWLGPEYTGGNPYGSTPLLFQILIIASVASAGQRIGVQVLLGGRRLRVMAMLTGIEGVANLLLSLVLLQVWGLYGVALGTLVPAIAVQGVAVSYAVCKHLNVSVGSFAASVAPRVIVTAAVVCLLHQLIQRSFPEARSWTSLLLFGGVAASVSILTFVSVSLRSDERKFLWDAIAWRVRGFFSRLDLRLRSVQFRK